MNIIQRYLEMSIWAQIFLPAGLIYFTIQFLRANENIDDWFRYGYPFRIRLKLDLFFLGISDSISDVVTRSGIRGYVGGVVNRTGIKAPVIKYPGELLKIAGGLFIIYIFYADVPALRDNVNLLNYGLTAQGTISKLEPFYDYIDNDEGNGGAFIVYLYDYYFITPDGVDHAGQAWSRAFSVKNNELENRELPFEVTMRYDASTPEKAYALELSDNTFGSLSFSIIFMTSIFAVAGYIVLFNIYMIVKKYRDMKSY